MSYLWVYFVLYILLDDGVFLSNVGNLSGVVSRPEVIIDCWDFLNDLGDIWLLGVGTFFRIVIAEFNAGFVCVPCAMFDF